MKTITKLLSVIFIFALIGCATIVGSKTQLMPIKSTPDSAKIEITDESGQAIFKGQTPTTVTLEKSTGKYWGKKSYTIKISKDGFKTQTIAVTAHANGWYIGGNIIFGGLIGWFIVDPFNGGMYTLAPDKINGSLGEVTSNNGNDRRARLSIVLLEDVPKHLRDKMVRIK
jgi:hypothetical protein